MNLLNWHALAFRREIPHKLLQKAVGRVRYGEAARVPLHPAYVASYALADILKKIIKDFSLGNCASPAK